MATINDAKYACTTSSIWVCMIEGRFLVAKGHAAWKRKADAVKAFKYSEYWSCVVDELKNNHPDMIDQYYRHYGWWINSREGKKLEDEAYQKLLEDGKVKYIEIEPVPDWV